MIISQLHVPGRARVLCRRQANHPSTPKPSTIVSRPSRTRRACTIHAAAVSLHRMDSASTGRHFNNSLTDWDGTDITIPRDLLQRYVSETVEQVVRARHANDPFAYVGSTGVAYMLWHIATAGGPPQASHLPTAAGIMPTNNWLERGLRYTRAAVQDVQRYSREQYGASLLCGIPGVLVAAALMAHAAQQVRLGQGRQREGDLLAMEVQGYVRQYVGLRSVVTGPFIKDDEFLYGRAGYLFGALLLNQTLGSNTIPHQDVQYVIDALLRSGRRLSASLQAPCPLWYRWPAGRNPRPYLGAAHGLMGILHVLLMVHGMLQRSTRRELEACLDYILTLERDDGGNPGPGGWFPTAMTDTPGQEKLLVHWCHGSPGAVFLFARAYKVYGKQEYLDVALRAGQVTWERGLLRKGNGLCHGVSGCAYAQLTLYKFTQDPRHLHRALEMAKFMHSEEFIKEARTPDRPFSLYEGAAGAACLYADLLTPEAAAFPLFELRPRGSGSSMAGSLVASLDEEQGGVVDTGGQEMQRT